MYKSKTAIFLDTFALSIAIFLISYIWINKFIKNAILSLFFANIISIFAFIVIFKSGLNKYKLSFLKHKELEFAKQCFSFLQFCPYHNLVIFFEKLLNSKNITNSHLYENKENYFYINIQRALSANDFLKANNIYLSNSKNKPLCFISSSYDESFKSLLDSSPTKFTTYNQMELFELMKEKNIFPISQDNNSHHSLKNFKQIKSKIFSQLTRKNFKQFFLSGLSLITFSIFIPFSTYYLVFGTILLLLSMICIFKNNQVINDKEKTPLTKLIKK